MRRISADFSAVAAACHRFPRKQHENNTLAQMQKILDAITGNRMADMQNQINQLQLQAAMCGVPKTSPYCYGIVPQFPLLAGCNGCNGNSYGF